MSGLSAARNLVKGAEVWQSAVMWLRLFLLCVFLPFQAVAGQMSAAEFEAYVTGKTLFYSNGAAPYGAEIYLPDRRVRWSFLDGDCKDGTWYEDSGLICFVYDDRPEPQCWSFELGASGLIARFENEPASTALYEASDIGEELICLGPKVGV